MLPCQRLDSRCSQQPVANSVPNTQPKFFESNYLRPTSFLRKSLPLIAVSGLRGLRRRLCSRLQNVSTFRRVIAAIRVADCVEDRSLGVVFMPDMA